MNAAMHLQSSGLKLLRMDVLHASGNRDGNKRDLEDEFHCFSYFQGCLFIYVYYFKLQIYYLAKDSRHYYFLELYRPGSTVGGPYYHVIQ